MPLGPLAAAAAPEAPPCAASRIGLANLQEEGIGYKLLASHNKMGLRLRELWFYAYRLRKANMQDSRTLDPRLQPISLDVYILHGKSCELNIFDIF